MSSYKEKLKEDAYLDKFETENFDIEAFLKKKLQSYSYGSVNETMFEKDIEKLNRGIEMMKEAIKEEMEGRHEEVIKQVHQIKRMREKLNTTGEKIQKLRKGQENMKSSVGQGIATYQQAWRSLKNKAKVAEILRAIDYFIRLKTEIIKYEGMKDGNEVAQGTRILENMKPFMNEQYNNLDMISNYKEKYEVIREKAKKQAENILEKGLEEQDQVNVANACKAFFNLNSLAEMVKKRNQAQHRSIMNMLKSSVQEKTPFEKETTLQHILKRVAKMKHLQYILKKQHDPETLTNYYEHVVTKDETLSNAMQTLWNDMENYLKKTLPNRVTKHALEAYPDIYRRCKVFMDNLSKYMVQPDNVMAILLVQSVEPAFVEYHQHQIQEYTQQILEQSKADIDQFCKYSHTLLTQLQEADMITLREQCRKHLIEALNQLADKLQGDRANTILCKVYTSFVKYSPSEHAMLTTIKKAIDQRIAPTFKAIETEAQTHIFSLHYHEFVNASISGSFGSTLKAILEKNLSLFSGSQLDIPIVRSHLKMTASYLYTQLFKHVSLICPLSEQGRKVLLNDMNEGKDMLSAYLFPLEKMPTYHTIYSTLANVLRLNTKDYLAQQSHQRKPSIYIVHHLFTRLSNNRTQAKVTPYQLCNLKIQEYEEKMEEEPVQQQLQTELQSMLQTKKKALDDLPTLEKAPDNLSGEEKRKRNRAKRERMQLVNDMDILTFLTT